MKIKCDYCGSMFEEEFSACPSCGAASSGVNRFANRQPRTIEELKSWYVSRKLPPENVTRFFIGKDVREPRAFGIYQDAYGDFVVYKNKSDGQRAIRYQGKDEAYAVNELYQRLRAEIADQKSRSAGGRSFGTGGNGTGSSNAGNSTSSRMADVQHKATKRVIDGCAKAVLIMGIVWMMVVVFIIFSMTKFILNPRLSEGYYNYQGDVYYYQNDSWYCYDEEQDDWHTILSSQEPDIDYETQGEYRTYDHEGMQFEDSTWYVEETVRSYDTYDDYDDDWDSDYDWDSGDSWDSSSSDWDSDW